MFSRRRLLQTLAAVPLLALNLPARAQTPAAIPHQLPLRGLDRHQGRALWPVFRRGDALRLALPQDESAMTIAVYWGDFLIGHLPEGECEALQPCVARGELRAVISELREPARELLVGLWKLA